MSTSVANILSSKGAEVATIAPDATLEHALALLSEHNIGALVVSEDGSSVDGILSERDIVRRLHTHGRDCLEDEARQAMTTEVWTCHGGDTSDQLMAQMTERRFRHVPVVDGDQHLAGIVSIGDVVRFRILELETQAQSLSDYVTGSSY